MCHEGGMLLLLVFVTGSNAYQPSRSFLTTHYVNTHIEPLPTTRLDCSTRNTPELGLSAMEAPPWQAYALVTLVPIVWGTYSPLIKYIYSGSPDVTPPTLMFNALSYVVSFSVLSLASRFTPSSNSSTNEQNLPKSNLISAGAELGLYLFLGSTMQLQGLQGTSPVKAGVIVQSTTVLVPLLDSLLSKKSLPIQSYVSCGIATLGIIILSVRQNSVNEIVFQQGDLLVLIAAVFYSLHVVRLGALVGTNDPLQLSQAKSFTELALCITALFACFSLQLGDEYVAYIKAASQAPPEAFLPLVGVIMWNGAFATALTQFAQSFGQRTISATQANLIYSSQPVWSAFFSLILLRESVDAQTVVGSCVLMVGILSAVVGGKRDYQAIP